MLHRYCSRFLAYCELADFSARSILALTIRLNELANFLKIQRIRSVKKFRYRHLIDFAANYNAPSIHVTFIIRIASLVFILVFLYDAKPHETFQCSRPKVEANKILFHPFHHDVPRP